MTDPRSPSSDMDADHLVETPETLRDSDPEVPPLDRGGQASDTYRAADRYGTTAAEQRHGLSMDMRLAEEEPDVVTGEVGTDGGDLPAEEAAVHVTEEG